MAVDLDELVVADAAAWRRWLERHHASSPGVWLVLAKKGTERPTRLGYDGALIEALCAGWIDGQVGRRDETTYRQRFTPRRLRSSWSRRNVELVTELIALGRMLPGGLAAVDAAKADGRWGQAYEGQATIQVPAELAAALAADPEAAAAFGALTSQNRYAVIRRITLPKQAATRARRLEEMMAMLRRGETIHPQRRPLR